jgi:Beta-lactamase enzyme family
VPAYAGANDEEMLFSGSLLKICPMYAAYALRHQVRLFVAAAKANGSAVTLPGIASDIEAAWRPRLATLFAGRPTTAFGSSQDITFPRLDQIFTFGADGTVDFASDGLSQAQIDAVGEFGAPKGKFHDWMRSMLRWSNNDAAGRCIMALGYVYLNGLLAEGDFFDPSSGAGLWASADYRGHDWVKTTAERNANAGGQKLTPRWATAQGRQRSNFAATAAQVARLMTMLAQGTLVDSGSCKEMRDLMNAADGGIGSYVEDALVADSRPASLVVSKIGYGDDKFSHDCAIVERTVAGKQLRYVAIGLGSKPSQQRNDLNRLFARMDQAVVARNS